MKKLIIQVVILYSNFYADGWGSSSKYSFDVSTNKLYINECTSCLMPYQAGLLPSTVMANLDDIDTKTILNYLQENSKKSFKNKKLSKKIAKCIRKIKHQLQLQKCVTLSENMMRFQIR